jgi:uncharacterized iron-regulated membrane protein
MNESTTNETASAAVPNPRWRPIFGSLHRWVGLFLATFLFLTGVTGSVISWDHELDELLNPHLLEADGPRGGATPTRSSLDLARDVEARHPNVQVTYLPLEVLPGRSIGFGVSPRVDPRTQEFFGASFNQVFVDPNDGMELGLREWGAAWPVTRENFVSFLYKLHFSLHLPPMFGTDQWGVWLLGAVALLWTLDCFIGAYLTLPSSRRTAPDKSYWQRWRPSWRVRWTSGSYRLNFDVHRAGGLWTWGLLFVIAFTGFSMNLYREVFFPAMTLVSDVTPSPFDVREPAGPSEQRPARLTYADAIALGQTEAQHRGWAAPPGDVFYSPEFGIYGVRFFRATEDHGVGGVGHPTLYFDASDGRLLGDRIPWQGTLADVFVQAQFPLHSGRILGLPGRILISLMGLVVAGLSVTGVVIWLRKRKAEQALSSRAQQRAVAA